MVLDALAVRGVPRRPQQEHRSLCEKGDWSPWISLSSEAFGAKELQNPPRVRSGSASQTSRAKPLGRIPGVLWSCQHKAVGLTDATGGTKEPEPGSKADFFMWVHILQPRGD